MSIDSTSWVEELEEALSYGADRRSLHQLCQQRSVPPNLRPHLWQTCLQTRDSNVVLDEFFDLNEQTLIRSDCMRIAKELDNEGDEQLSVAGDIESIITTLCKNLNVQYSSNNGWIEVVKVLLSLKEQKHETNGLLTAIVSRFLPRESTKEQGFHLLRLLILYHDPELCSFLDSKKIHPEAYACSWFRSLFSAKCSLEVTLVLWDAYFLLSDPFLVFYIALVMLINSREQILEMKDLEQEIIVATMSNIPKALEAEDISDLLTLIDTHYCVHTPCLTYLESLIFMSSQEEGKNSGTTDLAHALCLPVQVKSVIPRPEQSVKYFVIDCRSADQYNSGHLSTAFHLDCSLMLQDRMAFEIAVDALLTVQKQAIDANSVAGGNHLCFLGSGRSDEDSYLFMVVASFLQKNYKFVSLCTGGFDALHDLLCQRHQENYLVDHDPFKCICCQSRSSSSISSRDSDSFTSKFHFQRESEPGQSTSIFDKLSSAVKSKTNEVKGKLAELVASRDKYKGLSLFDNGNDDFNFEDITGDVDVEVNVDQWASEHDAIAVFSCREMNPDHSLHESFLVLTLTHIFILRESTARKGHGKVVAKRPLEMIVQITSKRKVPEIITFKYGETNESSSSGPNIIATDSLYFSKPYDVTRLVKQQVIKVLDAQESGGFSGHHQPETSA